MEPGGSGISSDDWVEVLQSLFASESVNIRIKAAQDAIACQSPKVAGLLRHQLETDPSNFVRATLVKSLALVGRGAHIEAIVAVLEDEDDREYLLESQTEILVTEPLMF